MAFLLPGMRMAAHAQEAGASGRPARPGGGGQGEAGAPGAGSGGGERAPTAAGDGRRIEPPRLVEFAEPAYPPGARAARLEGKVVLKLLVDAAGHVAEAEVVGPAGQGFDEAAREAARRLRFTPARRDGAPVAARILYGYEFRLPEAPATGGDPAGGAGDLNQVAGAPGTQVNPGSSNPNQVAAGNLGNLGSSNPNQVAAGKGAAGNPGSNPNQVAAGNPGNPNQVAAGKGAAGNPGNPNQVAAGGSPNQVAAGNPGIGNGNPGTPNQVAPVAATPGTQVAATPGTQVAATPAATPGAQVAATAPAPVEVTVRGSSVVERLRQSAQTVTVIDTEQAQRQAADMGEVLARTEGIGVRRTGGLGSSTRFSLGGLSDDQIRFFLDGVPLDFAGYPFGIANVPVNLIDRVEIHRGVVPVRLGADALGGAVNLVTDQDVRGTHGAASYEVGSFDTHRLTATARHLHEPSGFFARVNGFFDYARNDYPVDVPVPGRDYVRRPAHPYRFHDAYRATGGGVELGFVNRPWARRLLLRAFVSDHHKEHQHKFGVMEVPYGAVTSGEITPGATLRYEHVLGRGVALDATFGYTYGRATFLDVSTCTYDWFGQCEQGKPGEIDDNSPRDQVFWSHSGYGRLNLRYRPHPEHALQISVSPTFFTRTGDERRPKNPAGRDPLTAERDLVGWVHGVEHQLNLLDDRLENLLFAKEYVQLLRSEESLQGLTDRFRRRDRDTHRFGAGDGLRYRFSEQLYAKASYEWATRLPSPDEVFGDGVMIRESEGLDLSPETSHNANLGVALDARDTAWGAWRLDANGYLREADDLIVLIGNGQISRYENVFSARALGVEAAAGWTSPGEHLALDGNLTYEDFRNTSKEGSFARNAGQRMPNRPWLFANGSARVELREVAAPRDELALTWSTRYVHGFFLSWEQDGRRKDKPRVPAQLLHSLALTYVARLAPRTLSLTVEGHNLTDEPAFDFYGVQRPGRAFFSKATLEM
ncbi:TonB-dependent siderophore myxochelin receptor MxcH [Sorangium sp. So ce131]|uniref:TonB-dependent siderophore myxochelin receptor MxcH n=1 Tax=Sorangium sp. So ce131 TaxID=3133282 RepID=UPI003F626DB6